MEADDEDGPDRDLPASARTNDESEHASEHASQQQHSNDATEDRKSPEPPSSGNTHPEAESAAAIAEAAPPGA